MNKIYAGMQIFAKYDEDFDTCAERDEIFVRAKAPSISFEDANMLDALGWEIDRENSFGDDQFWKHFT